MKWRDIAIILLRCPISRNTLSGRLALPCFGLHGHVCAIPHLQHMHVDNCAVPPPKKHKSFAILVPQTSHRMNSIATGSLRQNNINLLLIHFRFSHGCPDPCLFGSSRNFEVGHQGELVTCVVFEGYLNLSRGRPESQHSCAKWNAWTYHSRLMQRRGKIQWASKQSKNGVHKESKSLKIVSFNGFAAPFWTFAAFTQRKPKGDSKKNVTTTCDKRHDSNRRVAAGPSHHEPSCGSCAKGDLLREASSSSPPQRETCYTRPPSPRGRHRACLEKRLGSSPRGCWGTTLTSSLRSCARTTSLRRGLFGLPSAQGRLMAWQTVSRKGGGKGWNQGVEDPLLQSNDSNAEFQFTTCPVHAVQAFPGEQRTGKRQIIQRAGQFVLPRGEEKSQPQTRLRKGGESHRGGKMPAMPQHLQLDHQSGLPLLWMQASPGEHVQDSFSEKPWPGQCEAWWGWLIFWHFLGNLLCPSCQRRSRPDGGRPVGGPS